jgi:hypothetical protein
MRLSILAALVWACSAVMAHGGEESMDMGMAKEPPKPDFDSYPPTYFALADHAGLIYAHIAVMVISWVFLLPIGKYTFAGDTKSRLLTSFWLAAVMLSLARSRYTLGAQFVFLSANALGVVLSLIYNAGTPDLYPGNAHHKIGWIATWIVCSQVAIGLLGRVAAALKGRGEQGRGSGEQRTLIPVSAAAMAEHQRLEAVRYSHRYRLSNDSGQGTEPNTESLRSNSVSAQEEGPVRLRDLSKDYGEDDDDLETDDSAQFRSDRRKKPLAAKITLFLSSRAGRMLRFAYSVVDRTILIIGFVAVCTGVITYGRFFVRTTPMLLCLVEWFFLN